MFFFCFTTIVVFRSLRSPPYISTIQHRTLPVIDRTLHIVLYTTLDYSEQSESNEQFKNFESKYFIEAKCMYSNSTLISLDYDI